MSNRTRAAFAGALLLLTSVSTSGGIAARERALSDRLALWEAAIRWALTTPEVSTATTIFIRVDDDADPPASLLARLRDVPNLRKVSECPRDTQFDMPKPQPGAVLVSLGRVTWANEKRASLWISHLHGPASGQGCREHFERTKTMLAASAAVR
jgi:hypothetical protein